MGEERNSRVPLYCSNECVIAHTIKNSICQSLEKDALCSNSKSLKILEEFRQIYEERLRKIDEDTGGEGIELKLKTLTSWVNDLGEQNVMLVQTVEQLEQEAADRVALLEERLKKSSHIALEYMSKLEEYDNKMLDVTEDRVQPMLLQIKTSTKLAQAQQTEEILKNRIGNLQNDISGLLELIRRARCDGSWDTDGLSFLEVTYEDIFGSLSQQGSDKARTVDHLQSTITTLHQKLGESLEDYHRKETEVKVLQEQVAAQKADMMLKDLQLKHFAEKIQGFCVPGESKQVMHPEKSAFCDVAVMTDFSPGEDKPVTILWNRRSCQSESEVLEMSVNPCVNIDNLQKTLEPQQETLKMLQEKCNSNKRSVSFAPPCNEDYEHQIQELEEALKEAQNAREFRERRAVETNTELEFGSAFYRVFNTFHGKNILEKVKQTQNNVLNLRMPQFHLLGDSFEIGDTMAKSDGRKKVNDLEKKLVLHEKMNESQLKVIESLQDDLRKLKMQNDVLRTEVMGTLCKSHKYKENVPEQQDNKIKEYRIKMHGLECKLFLAEMMICEKNEMIQMLLYKLNSEKGIIKYEPKQKENNRYNPCNMLDNDRNEMQTLVESLQVEVETLKSTISANEKVIFDQQEMIRIQQDTLAMSQDEVKELQNQLKNLERDDVTTVSNLQAILSNAYQLEELQSRSIFEGAFGDKGKENNSLQSNYQDLECKFKETKKYCIFLLKQVLAIERELQIENIQQNKLTKMIMNVIMSIKDLSSKYIVNEEEMICDNINSNLEELRWNEPRDLVPYRESNKLRVNEKVVQTDVTSVLIEDVKNDIKNLRSENTLLEMKGTSNFFKNIHLNELRKLLDVRALLAKQAKKSSYALPMNYSEGIIYCNYLEHEINKLQDLLSDFQLQMSTEISEEKQQKETADTSDSLMKVAKLEVKLNETCEHYKMAALDCCKYQEQLLEAAEREVSQQEDFAEKERYFLKKIHQTQVENSQHLDTLHVLDEEVNMLQMELSERDYQLLSTAATLRILSSESSGLQKELQKQEMNVENLEEQLLHSNLRLQQALTYLDEKNNLLQKLNTDNREMQGHMRRLEQKLQSAVTPKQYTVLQDEITNFKSNIQQLLKMHEKSNLEVREHWWWDDGWHDE